MNDFDKLTKKHKHIICTLYKTYLSRLKKGDSIESSSYFEDAEELHNTLFPDLSVDDISYLCWYLRDQGFISCYSADDMAIDIELCQSSIVFMENKFKNNIKRLSDFILSLI